MDVLFTLNQGVFKKGFQTGYFRQFFLINHKNDTQNSIQRESHVLNLDF